MSKAFTIAGELMLSTGAFQGAIRQSTGLLTGFIDRLRQTIGLNEEMGERLTSSLKNFAKAGVAFLGAKKSLDLFMSGVERAIPLLDAHYELTIALMTEGEDPAAVEARLKRFKDLSLDISKFASGDQGQIEIAIATGLELGIPEEQMLGGLARYGIYYADATKQFGTAGKTAAMKQGSQFARPFNPKPEDLPKFFDLLVQGKAASAFTTAESFAHELGFAAPDLARMGMSPEDAATWLALVSLLRTEGSGTATRSGISQINQPAKKKLLKKYHLDQIFDPTGKGLKPLAEIDRIIDAELGKYTPEKQGEILSQIFGTEAALPWQALLLGDAEKMRADILSKPTVATRQRELAKTPGFKADAVKGTWETAISNLFGPGAELYGDMFTILDKYLVSPLASASTEHPWLGKALSYGTAGGAGALGGLSMYYTAKGAKDLFGAIIAGKGKGLLGFDALSIGKAKMLEGQMGIQPVSVINFDELVSKLPGGGLLDTAADAATGGGGGKKGLWATLGAGAAWLGSKAKGAAKTLWPIAAMLAMWEGNRALLQEANPEDTMMPTGGYGRIGTGGPEMQGLHQLTPVQAVMAGVMSLGDNNWSRYLAEWQAFSEGSSAEEAHTAGRATQYEGAPTLMDQYLAYGMAGVMPNVVPEYLPPFEGHSAEMEMAAALEKLNHAAGTLDTAATNLSVAADDLRRNGGTRGDLTGRGL